MRKEVRDAIIELEDEDGNIRPEDLVDIARSPNHILHPFFEWDDREAAMQYRLARARQLIREVRVEYSSVKREIHSVKAYVHAPDAGVRESRYVSVTQLKDDRERVRLALLADLRKVYGYLHNLIELGKYWNVDLEMLPDSHEHIGEYITTLEDAPDTLLQCFRPARVITRKKGKKQHDPKELNP